MAGGLRAWVLGVAVTLALAGCASLDGSTGAGGAAPGTLDLELGYGSGRPLDLPLRAPDANADATRALQEIESRRKADALAHDSRPDPTRRPDLDRDVTQGIQSRSLDRTIGH